VPPPTPARDKIKRPSRIMRHDSLLDNKLLVGLHFEEKHTGNIFEDEFEDHKLVGQGSFFQTFRAKERKTGVFYAIKRSMHTFRGRKERDQMLQEIKLVHMLGPHDNIIKYFRAWQEEQHFFVQLEACSCNLADFVALMPSRGMPVDQRFLLFCTRQIAQGLAHIHRSDLIHLDVKPANVLVWDYLSDYQPSMPSLEPTPQTPRTKNAKLQALLKQAYAGRYILKLGDFGQALLRDKWSDGAEGDAQYMAPELLRSDKPSTKADIFSLGLLLFELVRRRTSRLASVLISIFRRRQTRFCPSQARCGTSFARATPKSTCSRRCRFLRRAGGRCGCCPPSRRSCCPCSSRSRPSGHQQRKSFKRSRSSRSRPSVCSPVPSTDLLFHPPPPPLARRNFP